MFRSSHLIAGLVAIALAACSSETSSTAPDVDDDGIETLQSVSDSGWTMTAATPEGTTGANFTMDGTVRASISWSGAGSRATGACLIVRVEVGGYTSQNSCGMVESEWSEPVPCTTASQCAGYNVPSGAVYCTAPNNSGPKYCYVRPGSQADFCVGTPATGAPVAAPATMTTAWKSAWAYGSGYVRNNWYDCQVDHGGSEAHHVNWLMYGCFAGCNAQGPTPTPSVSSGLAFYSDHYQQETTQVF
jgi:hypothetical protein